MILNNGHHIVDTGKATLIETGEKQVRGDGYCFETHVTFQLWKTNGGAYFVTMYYEEYIAGWKFWKKENKEKKATGTQLVYVFPKILTNSDKERLTSLGLNVPLEQISVVA